MLDYLATNSVIILGIAGALAFLVEIIVEMTKNLPGIRKIPTKAYVLIVSIVCCVIAMIIYTSILNVFIWYYIVLAIFAAFIIGYLSMYGWDTLNELWKKYKKSE